MTPREPTWDGTNNVPTFDDETTPANLWTLEDGETVAHLEDGKTPYQFGGDE